MRMLMIRTGTCWITSARMCGMEFVGFDMTRQDVWVLKAWHRGVYSWWREPGIHDNDVHHT